MPFVMVIVKGLSRYVVDYMIFIGMFKVNQEIHSMSRNIEDVYQSIAVGMSKNIEGQWDKSTLFVEFFDGAANFKGEAFLQGDKNNFSVDDNAFDDFDELHQITTENLENKWNRAKFTLEPTGKFNMDFEWDQELADEIERLNQN